MRKAGGVANDKTESKSDNGGGVLLFLLGIVSCNPIVENEFEQWSGIYGVDANYEIDQTGLETYIFNRHRFAPENATFKNLSHEEIGKFGYSLYKHAEKYLTAQLEEFNASMQNEPNEKFRNLAQDMVNDNAFKRNVISIDSAIGQNTNSCAELFANMIYPLDEDTGHELMTCYYYLANRAYNDSLGQKTGTMPQANKDLDATKQELQTLGINAADQEVENTLLNLLSEVNQKTGVSVNTLRRGVNLALCSDGMWGARDLGGSAEAITRDIT